MTTTANKITIGRIVLVPLFLLLAYLNCRTASFIVYVAACLSDFADGYIARNFNQTSNFGKFMDPLADKMLVISAMCYFTELLRMPGWVVAVVCLREFAVAGLRMLAAEEKKVIAAGKSGKFKTVISMVGLGAMIVFNNSILDKIVWILILTTTIISGVEYFINNKNVLKEDK